MSETFEYYRKKLLHFVRIYWNFIILAILIILAFLFLPQLNIGSTNFNLNIPPYFKQNWLGILIVILVFVVIMMVSLGLNVSFRDRPKKVSQVIVVEKMTSGGFCDRKSESLEKSCSQLLKEPCQLTDCCAWAKRKDKKKPKCIAGNADGSIFKSDKNGKKYEFDYYYFKGKKIPISKLM